MDHPSTATSFLSSPRSTLYPSRPQQSLSITMAMTSSICPSSPGPLLQLSLYPIAWLIIPTGNSGGLEHQKQPCGLPNTSAHRAPQQPVKGILFPFYEEVWCQTEGHTANETQVPSTGVMLPPVQKNSMLFHYVQN